MASNIQLSERNHAVDSAATISPPKSHVSPNGLARHRTRDVLRSVMSGEESRNSSDTKWTSKLNQPGEEDLASSSIMFNKTWNIHKTTPFYNFNPLQYNTYESELLAFIVANARNMSSSTLVQQNQSGASTFIAASRHFPGQIDGSGRSLVETLDDLGDITGIKFQSLDLYDARVDDDGESGSQFSLMISINVKPKGKTREQLYFCAVILDQLDGRIDRPDSVFTHFNLVLLKAPVLIGQLLIQWLERKFDCKICRLLLQSYDLRRIVNTSIEVMYNHTQGQDERKARPIELHYAFPEGVSGLKSISVSLPTDEARQLLVSREEGSNSGFLDGVETHCTDSMRIDFGRLNLTRAGCSSWYLASEGKVKIFPAISERHSLGAFVHKIGECGT